MSAKTYLAISDPEVLGAARLFVPVNGTGGEGGHADRDVLGAVRTGSAVTYPFPGPRVNRLPGPHGHLALFPFHHQGPAQHDRELIELRGLPRLGPAGRAAHVRDAQAVLAGVNPPDELIDQLGRLAGRGYPARFSDQLRHDREHPPERLARAWPEASASQRRRLSR